MMQFPGLAHEAEQDGRAAAAPAPPSGALRALVRALDRHLRRRQGIFEFAADPDCVLRIALQTSGRHFVLPDGTRIGSGDPVVDLHLWNENLPRMESAGADLAWSAGMRHRVEASLARLAAWLQAHPEHAVVAVRARTPFVGQGDGRAMERIAIGYGFDPVPREPGGPFSRLHDLGENVLIWALVWVYNPGGLRAKRFMRRRHEFWISRRRFLDRYGAATPVNAAGRDG